MNDRLILVLYFGLGVILQGTFLLRNKIDWKGLLACLGWSLFGMMPGKRESHYDPYFHILLSFVVFAVVFAHRFRHEVLPKVNEKILLSYSLTFWYVFFVYIYKGSFFSNFLIWLFLIPTLGALINIFVDFKLNFAWKLVFYSWFIGIVLFMGLFQFSYQNLSIFFSDRSTWNSPFDCFLTGMTFQYLMVYSTYIFLLIPVRDKHDTKEDMWRKWHEVTDVMASRYDDKQAPYWFLFLIVFLQGGALIVNYFYHLVPHMIVVNVFILIPMLFLFGYVPAKNKIMNKKKGVKYE